MVLQPKHYVCSNKVRMFNVKFSYLNERTIAAVPDDALNSALWALLQPGPQLLEVHWWRVSYLNTPM